MGHDVTKLDTEGDEDVIRVDTWDTTGRHWIYYFTQSEGGEYEVTQTADVPYKGDRIEMEYGIGTAEEKMEMAGYSVSPYED